ncbi:sugar ABC transporter ATP-binding protein [Antarcticirhabdus aurantiaca]|uniref:Sugar ABC transporter ATP-binding protein n=2 Tax=Antarcticirhabdus aurantiaca TaxID=2606717 RepID=A0ACD4NPI0_9HYPH|nr:sugar ABC transporter ATP-binding protein [Antarcticirhabdus aurantiaca]WAJ28855.1 sugar ABC transporter ATP-binding protein [Jeongeuplla avenae]
MTSSDPDRLRLIDIGKSFGPLRALDGVGMSVKRGTVHGLLGENGAGKSTLLRILSGVFEPSAGHVEVDGVRLSGHGPVAARRAGIAMIHQELQHVPELTVAQNMFLGRPLRTAGGLLVDRRAQERAAAQALAPLDAAIDPAAPIRSLKVAQRQVVEIARAMMEDAKVLAMDEPTSSLTPAEFDRLAVLIADLAAKGVSIIYVSHKMDEVFRVCETATILRDGRKVADVALKDTSEAEVIARMVGRELAAAGHKGFAREEVVLDVANLTRGSAVKNTSFKLRRGEVLGISGLVGAGRTELLRLIAGVDRPDSGAIRVENKPLALGRPRAAIAAGLGLLPEERKRDGIVARRSVRSNIALSSMHRFSRGGFVKKRALSRESERLMRELNLRPLDIERPIGQFSGGNQQKAIIGRWIAAGARILLFDEPTRGIDVGAKAEIYALIEKLASEGRSMIVVSSELPEILRVSDRVLVMREGTIAGILEREAISEEAIVALAVPRSETAAAPSPTLSATGS